MKILGRTLTQDEIDRFDIWEDVTHGRHCMVGAEWITAGVFIALMVLFPGHPVVYTILALIFVVCTILISVLLYGLYRQINGVTVLNKSKLLVGGSPVLDWPFGRARWLQTAQAVILVSLLAAVAHTQEFRGIDILILLNFFLSQIGIYLRAVLTLRALDE